MTRRAITLFVLLWAISLGFTPINGMPAKGMPGDEPLNPYDASPLKGAPRDYFKDLAEYLANQAKSQPSPSSRDSKSEEQVKDTEANAKRTVDLPIQGAQEQSLTGDSEEEEEDDDTEEHSDSEEEEEDDDTEEHTGSTGGSLTSEGNGQGLPEATDDSVPPPPPPLPQSEGSAGSTGGSLTSADVAEIANEVTEGNGQGLAGDQAEVAETAAINEDEESASDSESDFEPGTTEDELAG